MACLAGSSSDYGGKAADASRKAADLAQAASTIDGKRAAAMRHEAANLAQQAALYALGVYGNLEAPGAADVFVAMANTWKRADGVASRLLSLAQQMDAEQPDS